ncbi:hypothetical protein M0R04_11660 [Candidatus Dojkabacteria bacterium]|jgi:hypothetical protein|nr:hypothetical protein [Candidatus Dojkabacteria bacterium]
MSKLSKPKAFILEDIDGNDLIEFIQSEDTPGVIDVMINNDYGSQEFSSYSFKTIRKFAENLMKHADLAEYRKTRKVTKVAAKSKGGSK